MTKDKFLEAVDKISNDLYRATKIYAESFIQYRSLRCGYLCNSIRINLNGYEEIFLDIFQGGIDDKNIGMFGNTTVKVHQETRFIALCLFEQVCLDEKLYLKF